MAIFIAAAWAIGSPKAAVEYSAGGRTVRTLIIIALGIGAVFVCGWLYVVYNASGGGD